MVDLPSECHVGLTLILGVRLAFQMATSTSLSSGIALSELSDKPLSVQAITAQSFPLALKILWAGSSFISFHQHQTFGRPHCMVSVAK